MPLVRVAVCWQRGAGLGAQPAWGTELLHTGNAAVPPAGTQGHKGTRSCLGVLFPLNTRGLNASLGSFVQFNPEEKAEPRQTTGDCFY